jgi:hypothetical protein
MQVVNKATRRGRFVGWLTGRYRFSCVTCPALWTVTAVSLVRARRLLRGDKKRRPRNDKINIER